MELVLEQTQQGTSYEVSVSAEGVEELKRKVKIKGEKKEALLTLRQKPERFDTSAGNPVKEILLKLNLPDHKSILTDSKVTPTKHGGMTKPYSSSCFIANYFIEDLHKDGHGVKEFQERCLIQAFKTKKQQQYEHVGPKVTSSQDGKVYKIAKEIYCLVDDLKIKKFKVNFMLSQRYSQSLKSRTLTNSHVNDDVEDTSSKTKVKYSMLGLSSLYLECTSLGKDC
ncbi:hypothetical protein Tco_0374601 [Tanacetum coccineum]